MLVPFLFIAYSNLSIMIFSILVDIRIQSVKRSAKSNNFTKTKKKREKREEKRRRKQKGHKVIGHTIRIDQANAHIIQGLIDQKKLELETSILSNM